jgi:pimeloyl-ACP methyl ester carboxylesterase
MTLTQTMSTHTLDVPGATLTYDVRPGNGSGDAAPLMLIGSPMGASGFGTLAGFLADRTLITYDPRGAERSAKDDPATESTPEQHADDIHAVIEAVGLGPVDLFASSGGAVNALALVARHPSDVRTLVAHEPPLASLVPDRAGALAASRAIRETYMRSGSNAGMAHFIAVVSHQGEFSEDWAKQPAPDPQMFGMPADDDGTRDDVMLFQNMITCTHYEPDFEAIAAAPTRVVLAAGEKSAGTLASRGAYAAAARLGQETELFPSDHGGFMGGEYGQPAGEPEAFAAKLREVLAGAS